MGKSGDTVYIQAHGVALFPVLSCAGICISERIRTCFNSTHETYNTVANQRVSQITRLLVDVGRTEVSGLSSTQAPPFSLQLRFISIVFFSFFLGNTIFWCFIVRLVLYGIIFYHYYFVELHVY